MKMLNINGEGYTFTYGIEASLYPACTESLLDFVSVIQEAEDREDIRKMLRGITGIPQVALTLFYAGLMEDGRVKSLEDAKSLIKVYLQEHKDDDTGTFAGVLGMCLMQMAEDGFFKLIGLEDAQMEQGQAEPVKKTKKKKE